MARRKILQLDEDYNLVKEWESGKAARDAGFLHCTEAANLDGKRFFVKGFIWLRDMKPETIQRHQELFATWKQAKADKAAELHKDKKIGNYAINKTPS